MQGETKARWIILCEQAAQEQDPGRLLALVREINELLQAKAARMADTRQNLQADTSAK